MHTYKLSTVNYFVDNHVDRCCKACFSLQTDYCHASMHLYLMEFWEWKIPQGTKLLPWFLVLELLVTDWLFSNSFTVLGNTNKYVYINHVISQFSFCSSETVLFQCMELMSWPLQLILLLYGSLFSYFAAHECHYFVWKCPENNRESVSCTSRQSRANKGRHRNQVHRNYA